MIKASMSQHHPKWRKTWSNTIKHSNKAGFPTDPTPFQYIVWKTTQHDYTREVFQRDTNRKKIKLSLFANNGILNKRDPQNSIIKPQEWPKYLAKWKDIESIYKCQSPSFISLTSMLRKDHENTPNHNTFKNIGINITKEVKDIKRKLLNLWRKRWRKAHGKCDSIPCSWICRTNVIKMAILPKHLTGSL